MKKSKESTDMHRLPDKNNRKAIKGVGLISDFVGTSIVNAGVHATLFALF